MNDIEENEKIKGVRTIILIELLSLTIEVVTLAVTALIAIKAYEVSKKANIISINAVRPYLNIIVGDYNNKTYVKIRNSGLGTAIIKDIKFVRKNVNAESIMELAESYDSTLVKKNYNTFVEDIKERGIAPQEDVIILEKTYGKAYKRDKKHFLENESEMNPDRKYLLEFLCEVEIEILYEDIFRKKQKSAYRKLDFFGRSLNKEKIESN